MPINLAINGITEIYPTKQVGSRSSRAETAGDGEPHGQHSPSLDHSALTAQTAYRQTGVQQRHPKPVVLARDLMNAPVVSLSSDSMLLDAWVIMSQKRFHHIPVTSLHGTLVGMVSYRDLLLHVPELITAGDKKQAAQRRLAEVMTPRVITATPTTEIREIAHVMLDEQIHAVPILDQYRLLAGIVSTHDLLQAIAHHGPLELWT
ncbi:MAG: CBS domain-containing protein [Nitrospira sp.]|nr:CBS domain-containing protein [Nitrospira sp.]MDR4464965.1 CBS domain-containing protein [Nitrospira sp.]